jgi:hypothetical protein
MRVMDVIVSASVSPQEVCFAERSDIIHSASDVSVGVGGRGRHVPLSIDRVVVKPVRYGSNGHCRQNCYNQHITVDLLPRVKTPESASIVFAVMYPP